MTPVHNLILRLIWKEKTSGLGRNRTHNLQNFSVIALQLSYLALGSKVVHKYIYIYKYKYTNALGGYNSLYG